MSVVFLLGGPGSGKGTECELLKRDMGEQVSVVSVGEELRKKAAEESERARQIAGLMIEGKILPSEWTLEVLKEGVVNALKRSKLVVIDGFPRNVSNWLSWQGDEELKALPLKGVVLLECDQSTMQERIMGRGSGRVDDNIETVRKRIDGFYRDTMETVVLMSETVELLAVDGNRDRALVHRDVVEWLLKSQ